MSSPSSPAFDAARVRELASEETSRAITVVATEGAIALGLLVEDVFAALANLDPHDFVKSMPSEKQPGTMLDVYYITYEMLSIYVKLQIVPSAKAKRDVLLVVSFKRNERSI